MIVIIPVVQQCFAVDTRVAQVVSLAIEALAGSSHAAADALVMVHVIIGDGE